MWKQLKKDERLIFFLPAILLMVGAYLLFVPNFDNTWTYDDYPVIINNPDISSIEDLCKSLGNKILSLSFGRSLREITYFVDYTFFDLEPAGYHIQNIFWHGLNTILVFALVCRLEGGRAMAWIASLLFLVHPIHVEVVAHIAHRKDSLALAFSLLSFLSYTEIFQPSRSRLIWFIIAIGLAILAFAGKQNALVLPLIFMAYEKGFLVAKERFLLQKAWPWILLFVGAIVLALLWYLLLDGRNTFLMASHMALGRMNHFSESSESIYFLMLLKSWMFIFFRLFLPLDLSLEYSYLVPKTWSDLWVLSALAGIVLYCFLTIFTRKRWPIAFLSLCWIGIFWLPTCNLWPITNRIIADRYLYAPSVGFCVGLGFMLTRIFKQPTVRNGAVFIQVLVLSILTWQQNGVWDSSFTLWHQAVKVNPQSSPALNNLGKVYLERGDYRQAALYFTKSIKANPFNASPYYNLGLVNETLGNYRKAITYYKAFIQGSGVRYRSKAQRLRKRILDKYGVRIVDKS
jgi:hypothetical protein